MLPKHLPTGWVVREKQLSWLVPWSECNSTVSLSISTHRPDPFSPSVRQSWPRVWYRTSFCLCSGISFCPWIWPHGLAFLNNKPTWFKYYSCHNSCIQQYYNLNSIESQNKEQIRSTHLLDLTKNLRRLAVSFIPLIFFFAIMSFCRFKIDWEKGAASFSFATVFLWLVLPSFFVSMFASMLPDSIPGRMFFSADAIFAFHCLRWMSGWGVLQNWHIFTNSGAWFFFTLLLFFTYGRRITCLNRRMLPHFEQHVFESVSGNLAFIRLHRCLA